MADHFNYLPKIMTIADNFLQLRRQIEHVAQAEQRAPDSVRLLAVSKRHSTAAIREAAAAGQTAFAENNVHEALAKIAELAELGLEWHFIGAIQRNKTRDIASHFAWVHSVDRFIIAQRLSEQRPESMPPLQICLQVNLDAEPQKAGVSVAALEELASQVVHLPRITLRGLMAIPKYIADEQAQRESFMRLTELQTQLQAQGYALDTLSMGMSQDYPAAIAAGATIIRVGTALFGARNDKEIM